MYIYWKQDWICQVEKIISRIPVLRDMRAVNVVICRRNENVELYHPGSEESS
jgi:hypothetical protein